MRWTRSSERAPLIHRHARRVARVARWGARLPGGLEQLDGISVRVLDLDLLAAGSGLHVVAEAQALLRQGADERRQVGHAQNEAVPSARLLPLSVRHGSGTGRPRAAEEDLEAVEGDAGEGRQLLVHQPEPEMLRVERGGPRDALDLVAHAVDPLD